MMRHFDNDGHTETTINVFPELATINIAMLPGYRHWTRPSAALIRRWVDENIASSENRNRKRSGRIEFTPTWSGWRASVVLTEA